MDNIILIEWRGLVIFVIVVVIMMAETTSSIRSGRGKRAREIGLDMKETEIITAAFELDVFELDVLRGLDLKKGDIHNGIRHVKLYLARFGYLSQQKEEQDAKDGLFDERLEAGLREYQSSFNLSVTGFLDRETLDAMLIPRCGREDVPDVSLLFLPRPPPSNSDFWNHSQWRLIGGKPKWLTTHDLTYAFSSTISNVESIFLSKEDIRSALASAFDSWAAVVPLNFSETNQFEKANIKIGFVAGNHGDGLPFQVFGGTVAHAFPPEDGRFHFNSDKVWMVNFHRAHYSSAFDIQSTAVHEIGHLIGLDHSKQVSSVMYPNLSPGDIKHALTADDIHGARALYGTRTPNHQNQKDYQQEEEQENKDDEPHWFHLLKFVLLMLAAYIMVTCTRLGRHI